MNWYILILIFPALIIIAMIFKEFWDIFSGKVEPLTQEEKNSILEYKRRKNESDSFSFTGVVIYIVVGIFFIFISSYVLDFLNIDTARISRDMMNHGNPLVKVGGLILGFAPFVIVFFVFGVIGKICKFIFNLSK